MLNVGVIGIGNCGNQVARLAFTEANCDVYALNTSEDDLATLPDAIPRRCIGNAEGSGKDRKLAQKYLKESIMEVLREEEFGKFMAEKDMIFIVSSTGGGSGSGAAPILHEAIRSAFKTPEGELPLNIILIGVLPRLAEGESTQANMLAYMHELYDVVDRPTYMIYDNNNFSKESAPKVLEMVNREIVEDIKVLRGQYNNQTIYDSMDPKDMKICLLGPGRVVVATIQDIKEKDLDDKDIEDLIIEKLKKSAHAELQRDGIIANTGLITNLSQKLSAGFDTHLGKVREFVGEPGEEFLHTCINGKDFPNNVSLILTGLSKISDRIDKTRERLDEIAKKKSAQEERGVEISSEELEALDSHRNRRTSGATQAKADLGSIFDKFGV